MPKRVSRAQDVLELGFITWVYELRYGSTSSDTGPRRLSTGLRRLSTGLRRLRPVRARGVKANAGQGELGPVRVRASAG